MSSGEKRRTIFRVVGPNRAYTKLSNTLLADRSLSLECKGMLVSVLMLPTDWAFTVAWFRQQFGLGRDKAYALIREAAERGYCRKVEHRSSNGSMVGVEYQFSDDPSAFPPSEALPTTPDTAPFPEKAEPVQPPALPDTAGATSGKSERVQITSKRKNNSEKEDVRERVRIEGEQIQLCDDLRAYWLRLFDGDGESLDLALMQASGYIQPNSATRSLETQVSSQLAKIVRERKDRDRRYNAAADNRPQRASPHMTNMDRKVEGARRCRQLLRDMRAKEIAQ
jgi:hypothetical protein